MNPSKAKKPRSHSTEARARYSKGERYSTEATTNKRQKNYQRWLTRAKLKYGQRFDYSLTAQDYKTQKDPPVTVICVFHDNQFSVLPDKHIQNDHGGCKECSEAAKRRARLASEKKKFQKWFDNNRSERLAIVSEFLGMTAELTVRCKIHNSNKTLIPSSFMGQDGYGCDVCAAEATGMAARLTLPAAQSDLKGVLPPHISISAVRYDEDLKSSLVHIHCERHQTESWERVSHVRRSPHICRVCGEGKIGFASNRMRTLLETGKTGETASIAVMEIEALGIKALKVGVTTRSLPERYTHHLKTVFFEARLREIDAYVLENQIKIEFKDQRDERIIKAGMRGGSRWSGDTELYWFKQRQPIISFVNQFLSKIKKQKPNYELELGRMVIPTPFPVSHNREKSERNKPVAVIGINPKTDEVVHHFKTISDARRAGYRNVSMVLSNDSNRQLCGGLRWFRHSDFDPDEIPQMTPAELGLPVFCVELNQHFQSTMEAERSLREAGFEITGSHISSVLNGHRTAAGGLTWTRSELSRVEIQNQDPANFINYTPKPNSNSPKPVRLIDLSNPEKFHDYGSISQAAKSIGTGSGNISKALRFGSTIKGFQVLLL